MRELEARLTVRVLIVRIGAMGDVLHAMPAVAALRAAHPDWFIGWAIEPRWSDLLQIVGRPRRSVAGHRAIGSKALVDRWYSVPTRAWKQQPLSREDAAGRFARCGRCCATRQFDLCVDMQGAIKSAAVGLLAEAKVFAGPAKPRERVARLFYDQQGGGDRGACGGAGMRTAGRGGGRGVAAGAGDAADG